MCCIKYFFIGTSFFIKKNEKKKISEWIKKVINKEWEININNKSEINLIFCKDKYLNRKNIKYLKHNNFTDIITFDYSENKKKIKGDIYISVDRIKENSKFYKKSFYKEFKKTIIHGILHLLEYNDISKKLKKEMKKKEKKYINYFLKNNYISSE